MVTAIIGTRVPAFSISLTAVTAALSCPATNKMSGLSCFSLSSVADMLSKFSGSSSSMMHAIPRRWTSERTPARTSREKASFSLATRHADCWPPCRISG